ncbi:Sparc-related modular calcium-binding protein 1 [Halotydeus destructor]|nr:Sparc-related modular calcium-binding protein 1 [Halotydeus destructor]
MYPRPPSAIFNLSLIAIILIGSNVCQANHHNSQCSSCSTDPDKEPICGSNGRTYLGLCLLNCHRPQVTVKHRGHCSQNNSCSVQRQLALDNLRSGSVDGVYVPDCDQVSGKWKTVQCHESTGYCWCVNPADGRPYPGSSVRNEKPDCERITRKVSPRRSPRRGSNIGSRSIGSSCSHSDRATFVFNLMTMFKSEFERSRAGSTVPRPNQRRVINWKFGQLDTNKDKVLRNKELRDLKRLVKKIVQPRPCARMFGKMLDSNQDSITSKDEWTSYFRQSSKSPGDRRGHSDDGEMDNSRIHPDPLDFLSSIHATTHGSPFGLASGGGMTLQESKSEEDEEEEEDDEEIAIMVTKDCASSRASALKASVKVFVPECEVNGSFKAIQCLDTFCWCVDPQKGTPMRGTRGSSGSSKPDCSHRTMVQPKLPVAQNKSGCTEVQKFKFLGELFVAFEEEMFRDRQSRTSSSKYETSRWKFAQGDRDGNGLLEKVELQEFRRSLRSHDPDAVVKTPGQVVSNHRKCFRLFITGCDINHDKRISITEWLECTGVEENDTAHNVQSHQSSFANHNNQARRRKGQNPFHTILKAD